MITLRSNTGLSPFTCSSGAPTRGQRLQDSPWSGQLVFLFPAFLHADNCQSPLPPPPQVIITGTQCCHMEHLLSFHPKPASDTEPFSNITLQLPHCLSPPRLPPFSPNTHESVSGFHFDLLSSPSLLPHVHLLQVVHVRQHNTPYTRPLAGNFSPSDLCALLPLKYEPNHIALLVRPVSASPPPVRFPQNLTHADILNLPIPHPQALCAVTTQYYACSYDGAPFYHATCFSTI